MLRNRKENLASLASQFNAKSAKSEHVNDFLFIGELAEKLEVNAKTIRYYEREGLIRPARHGKFRTYFHEDIDRLKMILAMRQLGVSIANIKIIAGVDEGYLGNFQLQKLLDEHQGVLAKKIQAIEDQLTKTHKLIEELDSSK